LLLLLLLLLLSRLLLLLLLILHGEDGCRRAVVAVDGDPGTRRSSPRTTGAGFK
jgi:hypothetical protein